MPLSLDQYANYLDTRDLPWPSAPPVEKPKARPHLKSLPEVRAVLWTAYGTLLRISGGELIFEHPDKFVMDTALEKAVTEFKMWGSMTRKPGQPAEYLRVLYDKSLFELRSAPSPGEKYPEVASEKVWEGVIKKLFLKEYKFDAGFFGSLNEFSKKVAYFFHASLQGTACPPSAAKALKDVAETGVVQGLLTDGQVFTPVQLARGLKAQDAALNFDKIIPPELRVLSCDARGRKPSENLFRAALEALEAKGIEAPEVLHVGSNLERDLVPAKRFGMRTALYAGDKVSLAATGDQLKDPASRPDLLLTELDQVAQVLG
jgi:FMN phosphatase YigB (HAD superfamily)